MSACYQLIEWRRVDELDSVLGQVVEEVQEISSSDSMPRSCFTVSVGWLQLGFPKLHDVIRCIGLLADENFSSLVLQSGFHKELGSTERVVSSFTC
ncbi:hypothetical protein CDL15_Pgr028661 [Punica granatum]|uniref:Uncharacterized protein n=1 Tax=Punica granatum TaxID=22663 RepID=A0A218VX92_PUNGR|nr:hypothetical protein CDL15_Pgr028661 [Punica granatum]